MYVQVNFLQKSSLQDFEEISAENNRSSMCLCFICTTLKVFTIRLQWQAKHGSGINCRFFKVFFSLGVSVFVSEYPNSTFLRVPQNQRLSIWNCLFRIHTYIHTYIVSSCCTASTDLLDPLTPPVSIAHRFREVFQAISCIVTELLYICSSRLSCLCSSMWRDPREYIAYEFILTFPAVSRMSGSSHLDTFRDDHTAAVLWGVTSKTCSIQLAAFLCNCRQIFSPYVLSASM